MRKRYLVKRLAREIRIELSKYSREELESLARMHILFMDDAPQEQRLQYVTRKSLARQMLASESANLGVSYRGSKRRKEICEF